MELIEENKYYIPEIEDIFIGYECEIYEQSTTKLIKKIDWHKVKVYIGNSEYGETAAINKIPNYLKQNKVRVSYLTKEQIIAEGWKDITLPESYSEHFMKNNCKIQWLPNKKGIYIAQDLEIIYKGFCKSINEFRKIIKMLGI